MCETGFRRSTAARIKIARHVRTRMLSLSTLTPQSLQKMIVYLRSIATLTQSTPTVSTAIPTLNFSCLLLTTIPTLRPSLRPSLVHSALKLMISMSCPLSATRSIWPKEENALIPVGSLRKQRQWPSSSGKHAMVPWVTLGRQHLTVWCHWLKVWPRALLRSRSSEFAGRCLRMQVPWPQIGRRS
ncbi:hypothetical protein IEO21_10590 [Rhodonia placenta]|uniref:Uncharacterized protein n=1 Tax=Rhodonia placenta TaxID=104341 RepID=A0A8H7NS72_9APHY|nr:hypothetical protein IEO21_10590 [Postia placenta]